MRPPICEVCDDEFDPADGALITCAPDEATARFEQRAEAPGFVGHPPNRGWFCARHRELAERLAPTRTLERVIHVAQRNDDIQACEVCGEHFDRQTVGGPVSFERTTAGTEYHAARIRNEEVGLHPDEAWICHAHVDPALRIRKQLTKRDALAELAPPGRPAYEYDERPPSTPPDLDEYRPPLRGPFRPVADDSLDDVEPTWHDVAARPVEKANELLRLGVTEVAALFGDARPRGGGSSGTNVDNPPDAWVPDGVVTSLSWRPSQVADATLFSGRYSFRRGERSGPVIGGTAHLLIQRRQRSIFEVAFLPAEPPALADDGVLLIERVSVRRAPDLEPQLAAHLDAIVDSWVAELGAVPFDPLDPAPDLVGVDLGSGTISRVSTPDGASQVRWPAGGSLAKVKAAMTERLPDFLAALGVDAIVELEATSRRNWTPMDRTSPPNCPYSDEWRWNGTSGEVEVTVWADSAHWDTHSISNVGANLWIDVAGERRLGLSFHQRFDSGGRGPVLSLSRPTTPAVVAVVRDIFGC